MHIHGDYRDSHIESGQSYDDLFGAGTYPKLLWQFEREILSSIVDSHFERSRLSHLDVACGTGRVLAHLDHRVATSVGIDISPSMLAVARRRCPRSFLVRGDFADAPPIRQMFDLITAFRFVLNAEPALRLAVARNVARTLKPRGLFVFNNHRNESSLTYRLLRAAGRPAVDLACMSDASCRELIDAAGLTLLYCRHAGTVPGTDKRMYVPYGLGRCLEAVATRIPALVHLSNDVVYVCARRA